MEEWRRRHDAALWLPPLPVWHRGRDRERTGSRGSGVRRSRRRAGGACRHAAALAAGVLCREPCRYRGAGAAHLRQETLAAGPAAARHFDWNRFRGPGVGDAVENPDGPRGLLLRHRQQDQKPQGLTRRRRRGRKEPDLVCGALPSRARQERRTDRLSLGHHPQAGDDRLGSRSGGDALGALTDLSVIARSKATKQSIFFLRHYGLPRGVYHRARIRATRWLAMTRTAAPLIPPGRASMRRWRRR